jgi:hypothetical protein
MLRAATCGEFHARDPETGRPATSPAKTKTSPVNPLMNFIATARGRR